MFMLKSALVYTAPPFARAALQLYRASYASYANNNYKNNKQTTPRLRWGEHTTPIHDDDDTIEIRTITEHGVRVCV